MFKIRVIWLLFNPLFVRSKRQKIAYSIIMQKVCFSRGFYIKKLRFCAISLLFCVMWYGAVVLGKMAEIIIC